MDNSRIENAQDATRGVLLAFTIGTRVGLTTPEECEDRLRYFLLGVESVLTEKEYLELLPLITNDVQALGNAINGTVNS